MSEENNENTTEKTGFQLHPENINRNGRPLKGHSITEIIKEMMDEQPDIKKALGKKIIALALEGDTTAIKTIWAYLDGMPVQKTDLSVIEKPKPILPDDVSTDDSQPEDPATTQTD